VEELQSQLVEARHMVGDLELENAVLRERLLKRDVVN
jgi:hypothetical protein